MNRDKKIHQDDLDATQNEIPESDPDATIEDTTAFESNLTQEDVAGSDPNATLEETAGSDPNATLEEIDAADPNATIEVSPPADSAGTYPGSGNTDHDATIEIGEELDPNATLEIDDGLDTDATVDQTSEFDPNATVDAAGAFDPQATVDSSDDFSVDLGPSPVDGSDRSVLDDSNLGQTINPRELSDDEASYWAGISAEFTSPGDPTVQPPPIDRTIVETRLRIRNQTVATQIQDAGEPADYRLVRLLGRGGMGNVFVARQGSLDRLIAVKVIRPLDDSKREKLQQQGQLEAVEQGRRQQFLTEAVVTGDLDHPNIVPIHDVALTGDSTLFYSMKRVIGTPWSDVIQEKTRDENLEILIKVADAIGFAHTRGVVHRDIKPENVMLGDFGVVMVMDWGIALAKPDFEKLDSITPATGLGGTPSMMAPEMATGPLEKIGPAADIYLLGATLFMIITGKPPHHAPNVSQCLRAVANNEISEFDPTHQGELMNIALKAMAREPADRYPDTKSFQDVIRQYRSHAESIALGSRAQQDLRIANEEKSYTQYTRAQFGFEEAIALWEGNQAAQEGLSEAKVAHADAAFENEDYDLGLSMLDAQNPEHQERIERLQAALRQRRQSEARFGILKKVAVALLAFILVGGSVAIYLIDRESKIAHRNALEAIEKSKLAEQQTELAERRTAEVVEQRNRADKNALQSKLNAERASRNAAEAIANGKEAVQQAERADENAEEARANAIAAQENADRAQRNERQAILAQEKAEYEAYVSGVGLAKARIDRNEFTDARRLIADLIGQRSPQDVPWELRYLSSLANQSTASVATATGVTRLAVADRAGETGNAAAWVRLDDGRLATYEIDPAAEQPIVAGTPNALGVSGDVQAACIAVTADNTLAAVGSENGEILIIPTGRLESGEPAAEAPLQRLVGHSGPVTALQWMGSEYLVSASSDRTVRIWNIESPSDEEVMWHIAPVVDLACSPTAEGFRIAAAISGKGLGRVVFWDVSTDGELRADRIGVFAGNATPLTSVAISPDGQLAAAGDVNGEVLLWPVSQIQSRDIGNLVKNAVDSVGQPDPESREQSSEQSGSAEKVSDPFLEAGRLRGPPMAGEDVSEMAEPMPAHRSNVRQVRFSADGRTLLTCGDDYLIHLWEVIPAEAANERPQGRLRRTLRGHGGAVADARFLSADGQDVLSVGADDSIRLWTSGGESGPTSSASFRPGGENPVPGRGAGPSRDGADAETMRHDPVMTHVHDDAITSAALSADGQHVVTASRDRTAKILTMDPATLRLKTTAEMATGESAVDENRSQIAQAKPIVSLDEGTEFRAMSMRLSRAAGRLFVGGADAVVRIWDLQRGTEMGTIPGTGLNQVLAVSADSRVIMTGSSSPEARVILWRFDPATSTATVRHRLGGHEESVTAVAIAPNAATAVTADRAGRMMVWDVQSGAVIGEPIDLLLGTRINHVVFSPDGASVWIAADDNQLSRFNVRSRQIVDRLNHDGMVTRVDLSADGRRAVTSSELQKVDATVHHAVLWQLTTSESAAVRQTLLTQSIPVDARTRSGGRAGIAYVAIGESGDHVFVAVNPSGDQPRRVEQWRCDDGVGQAAKEMVLGLPDRLGDVSSIIPVADNELISLHGNSAYRWNTASRSLEVSYRIHGSIGVTAFSPDGSIVLTGSGSLKAWDARSGVAMAKLESPHAGSVRSIAYRGVATPAQFFTGGEDGMIHEWLLDRDSGTFEQLGTIAIERDSSTMSTEFLLSLTVSPAGRQLLATTNQGRVILIDLDNGKQRVLFSDSEVGSILSGCFSSDGRFVAAAGQDRLARMWDLSQRDRPGDSPDAVFQGHAEAIEAVDLIGSAPSSEPGPGLLSPSTLRLVTASLDRSVRIWDPRFTLGVADEEGNSSPSRLGPEGRELLELVRHRDGVSAVDFNPGETLMITAGRDGNVVIWPANDP
ncbi:protein kinase domain-containing protein [Allorhodopirellula solitaria]|uniref:Serine/threonine-protein kinase PknD n=1 Tax=Allorhodopirellula solitaria TaxID=2527987 RepID=A0A5C5XN13_9BACT|nr:protein kinase [Allorhodopirellula solitaria]TWT64576.1 Serine/threonine-protein kinase PknD [Allorhodopirellula solitaria]